MPEADFVSGVLERTIAKGHGNTASVNYIREMKTLARSLPFPMGEEFASCFVSTIYEFDQCKLGVSTLQKHRFFSMRYIGSVLRCLPMYLLETSMFFENRVILLTLLHKDYNLI
jgi:hypothetical protein